MLPRPIPSTRLPIHHCTLIILCPSYKIWATYQNLRQQVVLESWFRSCSTDQTFFALSPTRTRLFTRYEPQNGQLLLISAVVYARTSSTLVNHLKFHIQLNIILTFITAHTLSLQYKRIRQLTMLKETNVVILGSPPTNHGATDHSAPGPPHYRRLHNHSQRHHTR